MRITRRSVVGLAGSATILKSAQSTQPLLSELQDRSLALGSVSWNSMRVLPFGGEPIDVLLTPVEPGKAQGSRAQDVWGPNGVGIVHVRESHLYDTVAVRDARARVVWFIETNIALANPPRLSADLQQIVFLMRRSDEYSIMRMQKGGDLTRLGGFDLSKTFSRRLELSPDGGDVLLSISGAMYRLQRDGGFEYVAAGVDPLWSTTGHLAYQLNGLCVVAKVGRTLTEVFRTKNPAAPEAWSPDGKYLLCHEHSSLKGWYRAAVYRIADGARMPLLETGGKRLDRYGWVERWPELISELPRKRE